MDYFTYTVNSYGGRINVTKRGSLRHVRVDGFRMRLITEEEYSNMGYPLEANWVTTFECLGIDEDECLAAERAFDNLFA